MVPRYYARPHAKTLWRGGVGNGDLRDPLGGVNIVLSENDAMLDQVAQFAACPNCKSKDFSQKRIWHLSKAETASSNDN